jgi:predicted nucleotidyltransferase component of viral defense system
MDTFLSLPENERRLYCEQAQARLGLSPLGIEKDFWVCWILRELIRLPEWGPHFTFKGGTSLSKCWKLIDRFSEDIDIVIDRGFLGFSRTDSPATAPSVKQRSRRLKKLRSVCQTRIQDELKTMLEARICASLPPNMTWSLVPDESDPDKQSLLFQYPAALGTAASYMKQVVRIEMGARSDTEPSESPEIQPYLAEAFPDLFRSSFFAVRTVAPERTFWEKAMLLHEETYRPSDRLRKAGLARHYYDLWCLITKGIAERAMGAPGLFDQIAQHRAVFFRQNWMDYDTLRPATLRLLPLESQRAEWNADYEAMRREMFFGEQPVFSEILRIVGDFQKRVNHEVAW